MRGVHTRCEARGTGIYISVRIELLGRDQLFLGHQCSAIRRIYGRLEMLKSGLEVVEVTLEIVDVNEKLISAFESVPVRCLCL